MNLSVPDPLAIRTEYEFIHSLRRYKSGEKVLLVLDGDAASEIESPELALFANGCVYIPGRLYKNRDSEAWILQDVVIGMEPSSKVISRYGATYGYKIADKTFPFGDPSSFEEFGYKGVMIRVIHKTSPLLARLNTLLMNNTTEK